MQSISRLQSEEGRHCTIANTLHAQKLKPISNGGCHRSEDYAKGGWIGASSIGVRSLGNLKPLLGCHIAVPISFVVWMKAHKMFRILLNVLSAPPPFNCHWMWVAPTTNRTCILDIQRHHRRSCFTPFPHPHQLKLSTGEILEWWIGNRANRFAANGYFIRRN